MPVSTTADLWGGMLTAVSFDPVTHVCDLNVVTTTAGETIHYVIHCEEVAEFHFRNAVPEPWDYAEVTEAELTVDSTTGRATLEMMLWSEDSGLVVSASTIQIHGDSSTGRVD
jgi:hypothetical protein